MESGTESIAFLTRSEVMRPLLVRFLIRPAFEEPEDNQAMMPLLIGGLAMRLWRRQQIAYEIIRMQNRRNAEMRATALIGTLSVELVC